MEYAALIGTVTFIHFLALISPGPDLIVAIKNSLSYSKQTGIWTAVGFGLGMCVHIFYCLAGLAFIISQSFLAFTIIKLLGAVYLLYIGIKSITSKSSTINVKAAQKNVDISVLQSIKMGFLTNVLNPKATLFFLSLFTFVLSPETPNMILVIVSIIMITNTIVWFSLVAIFFSQNRIRNAFDAFQGIFNKILGGLLIALGIKVALTHR